MTIGLPDVIGLTGSSLVVIAYAYSNLAKSINFILFNLLNLAGALMLMYSLSVHFNLASMALEFVWITIALFGLFKAIRGRTR